MKAIYFDRGIITDIMDSYETSYMANTLAVTLKTNLEYDVEISAEAQSWISCADTRAELREDTLSFTIEENPYDEPRTAVIHLVGALGDKLQSFEIVQQKSPLNAPIQFADQNVKKVCVEKFDTNGDGELSYKEAAKVERIDRKLFGDYTSEITSFDELQYFINITLIGDYAFSGCSSLTSVTIPDSVTTIGDYAFRDCASLTSVTIPDSVTSIGVWAFSLCDSLTSVTIPDSVTTIGYGAFYGCRSLKEFNGKFAADGGRCLIMGNTIIAYAEASGTTYTIPDGVTTIGDEAFYDCSSLTSVNIPDSVTSIGVGAFCYCSSLTSVTIPDSVITIGDSAFCYCDSLTSVTIPDSVTTINNWAFDGCSSLVSATIGDGVTTIGEGVFAHCDNIAEFKGKYATENSRCLVKDDAIIAYANASGTEYTIPDDIEMIEKSAFRGCTYLTAVIIHSGVKAIGINAFLNCGNLTEVYCKSTTPPTLGNGAFNENSDDRKIYVLASNDDSIINAYKNAPNWSSYRDDIVDYVEIDIPPKNEVWYKSTTGDVIELDNYPYTLVSNTYENGIGKYKFAEDVVDIGAYFGDRGNKREQVLQFESIILPSNVNKIDTYYAMGYLKNACCLILSENLEEIGTDFMGSFGEYLEEKHLYFISEECPKLYDPSYGIRIFWGQTSVLYVHYPKGSDYSAVEQGLKAWKAESSGFQYKLVETTYRLIHH